MSTNYDKSLNTNKKVRTAMERLEDLEKGFLSSMGVVDREMGSLIAQVNSLNEAMNAVVEIVGVDKVQEILTKKAHARLDEEKKQIDEALVEGKLVTGLAVEDSSIIGYQETDAAGNLNLPGKYYKNLQMLTPAAREALMGKEVGFEMPLGNGTTMKILEIYELVKPEMVGLSSPVQE